MNIDQMRLLLVFMLGLTVAAASTIAGEPMTYKTTKLTADAEPMQSGAFSPNWESLRTYQVPEWFRDAMTWYEKAEKMRPAGNDEAILRWNTCVRMLGRHERVHSHREYEPALDD